MTTNHMLPPAFEDLLTWVPGWALESENGRMQKRVDSPMDEIKAFYDAILPNMTPVMEYLETLPVRGLDAPDQNLLNLALSYVEVSRIFEVWDQQDVRADFFDPKRLNCIGYEGMQS